MAERSWEEIRKIINWIWDKRDEATGVLATIDYAHHKIHDGYGFVCHYTQTVSDTDDKSIIAFKTGATKYVHCTISASASTAATAYVSGTGPKTVGGLARDTQEWILKPNTLYAFVVNSDSDLDNTMWIEVDWYEQTDVA